MALALVVCAACPGPAPTTAREARPAARHAALELPPGPSTEARLAHWQRERTCAARWRRARWLMDLHDAEVFLGGESDRVSELQRGLRRRIGGFLDRVMPAKPGVGAGPRRSALRALFTPLPAVCPEQAALARHALALLAADDDANDESGPDGRPAAASKALRLAVAYKKVLLEEDELASNARLRLADWCADAFRAALRASPPRQQATLNRCLFALFDADPSPYFAADPARRPPDPPWTVLLQALDGELRLLEKSRFGRLAALQRSFDADYFLTAKANLPAAVDYRGLALPSSSRGQPHDRTPVVTLVAQGYLVDNLVVPHGAGAQLRAALARRLRGDTRATLTVVAAARTSLHGLFELGRAARRLKVATLLIGVRRKVAEGSPPGDVQARLGRGPVWRLEGVPLSIRLLSMRPGEPERDRPRQLLFDPRSVQARLALTLGPGGLQLSSADGRSPRWPGLPLRTLRGWLGRLRQVYPRESALLLAPARATTYAQLVQLLEATRFAGRRPLFPSLALTTFASILPPKSDLGAFARAWLAARVRLAPPDAVAQPRLRRCYLDALRAAQQRGEPLPTGVVAPTAGRRWPTKALGDPLLTRCLAAVLGSRPRDTSVRIFFELPGAGAEARAP